MSRTCSICRHGDVREIDQAIVSGTPQREVAETYRASRSAINRHASNHVAEAVQAAASLSEGLRHDDLVSRMLALVYESEQVINDAKAKGSDGRLVLAAVREVRETLGLLAKMTQAKPTLLEEEVEVLVKAMGRVLPRFPDATEALAAELRSLGAAEAADAIVPRARR